MATITKPSYRLPSLSRLFIYHHLFIIIYLPSIYESSFITAVEKSQVNSSVSINAGP